MFILYWKNLVDDFLPDQEGDHPHFILYKLLEYAAMKIVEPIRFYVRIIGELIVYEKMLGLRLTPEFTSDQTIDSIFLSMSRKRHSHVSEEVVERYHFVLDVHKTIQNHIFNYNFSFYNAPLLYIAKIETPV